MLYFLRKLNDIHPKKQQEPMRPSGNPSTADRDKLSTCGRGLMSQVNERVVLLWPGKVVRGRRFRSLCWLVDKVSNFLVGDVHGTWTGDLA